MNHFMRPGSLTACSEGAASPKNSSEYTFVNSAPKNTIMEV